MSHVRGQADYNVVDLQTTSTLLVGSSLVAVESPQMLAADEVLVVNAGDSGNVRSRLTRTFLSRQTVTTNRNHFVPVIMATRLPRGRLYGEHDPADSGVRRRPGLVPGPAAAYPRATCPRPQGLAEGTQI
jgi:hypothetical protein